MALGHSHWCNKLMVYFSESIVNACLSNEGNTLDRPRSVISRGYSPTKPVFIAYPPNVIRSERDWLHLQTRTRARGRRRWGLFFSDSRDACPRRYRAVQSTAVCLLRIITFHGTWSHSSTAKLQSARIYRSSFVEFCRAWDIYIFLRQFINLLQFWTKRIWYTYIFAVVDESVPSARWTRGRLGSGIDAQTQVRRRWEIPIFGRRSSSPQSGYRIAGCRSFVLECFSEICTSHAN